MDRQIVTTELATSISGLQMSDLFFNHGVKPGSVEREQILEDAIEFAMNVGREGDEAFIDALVEDFLARR